MVRKEDLKVGQQYVIYNGDSVEIIYLSKYFLLAKEVGCSYTKERFWEVSNPAFNDVCEKWTLVVPKIKKYIFISVSLSDTFYCFSKESYEVAESYRNQYLGYKWKCGEIKEVEFDDPRY